MKKIIKKMLGDRALFAVGKLVYNKVDELFVIGEFIRRTGPDGGIMLDVGTHHGASCSPFLKRGWKVYGFEPDPVNREVALRAVPSGSDFTLFDFALGDKPGEMKLWTSPQSSGISSLMKFDASHVPSRTVRVECLNEVLRKQGIGPVRVLKIDAEGYDFAVLKGLDLHAHPSIEFIICEYEDRKTERLGHTAEDMIRDLMEAGFAVLVCEWEPIVQYGKRHRFREAKRYPCALDSKAWGNLIAFKDERFSEFALRYLN